MEPNDKLMAKAEKILYKHTPQGDMYLYMLTPDGVPSGQQLPAVVCFTGGGWNVGDASGMIANVAWFRDHGYIGISADYRVKTRHGTTPKESVQDAKSAIRYVRAHAKELGVDPQQIIAEGGSAGGHLAACTAMLEGHEEPNEDTTIDSKPNALLLHNPVLGGQGAGCEFFAEHPDYAPGNMVRHGLPPTIISCGTEDQTTPLAEATRFVAAMRKVGNKCELISLAGAGHSCDWPVTNPNFLPTIKRMNEFLIENKFKPHAAQSSANHLRSSFVPGELWPDDSGVHINAHGGGILYHEGVYYWFGEHKGGGERGNLAEVGVSVYTSKDLYNWKNEGIALAVSTDPASEIAKGCIMERPKVVYNARTKKFVMWFHLEFKGEDYKTARTALAISDTPKGPYSYVRSFRPNAGVWPINSADIRKAVRPAGAGDFEDDAGLTGHFMYRDFSVGQMARDLTVFVDDDAKAYLITASEENTTLHIAELSDDYQGFTGKWARAFPGDLNEAPAIFKHSGRYYLIASGCSGWEPNPARSAVADSIWGPWTYLGNPARGERSEVTTTFRSQSTYVLPMPGQHDGFIFMADRWMPENAIDGRYVWLPIEWENEMPVIKWHANWSYDMRSGDKFAFSGPSASTGSPPEANESVKPSKTVRSENE